MGKHGFKGKTEAALQVLIFEKIRDYGDRVRVYGIRRKDQEVILGDEYPAAQKRSFALFGIGGTGDKRRQFRIVDGKRAGGFPVLAISANSKSALRNV